MHRFGSIAGAVMLLSTLLYPNIRHVPGSYATVQGAIDAAGTGDTVLVDPGTYFENIRFHGQRVLVASHYLFTRNQADVVQTIINGSQPVNPDTASCVLFISGEDSNSVLEGFTLTGGTGTLWRDIHNHNLYREGGGILLEFTSPIIRYNIIRNNDASNRTGGASAGGGGIRIGDANPQVIGNIIAFNNGRYGGGIVLNYTAATIRNNVIYRNIGGGDFGGTGIWAFSSGTGPKIIENNTIVENSCDGDGGGIQLGATSATIRNNIIWGNTASSNPQLSLSGGSFGVTFNDIQGGYPGTGNIDLNPVFMDTTHYLQLASPCVDAGDPGVQYNDPEDTTTPGSALFPSRGTLRNDMGAYGGRSRSSLYIRTHLNAPQPPTNVKVYSDFLTPSSIALSWVDPTQLFSGSPLTAFKIHIYRDAVLIASVDSGVGSFTDTGLALHQPYSYLFFAVTVNDSSPPVPASAIAGGSAFPRPPAGFVALDGLSGVVLQWFNPSRQADGTPLNDLAKILIYRDGLILDSIALSTGDTAQARSFNDTALGYHVYALKAVDNESPAHPSASTASLFGFGGVTTSYTESFENGRGGIYATGTWDTTSARSYDGSHSLTDSPGGNYATGQNTSVLLPPVIIGSRYVLQFENIAIVRGGHFAYVEISTDHRATFTTLKTFNWFQFPQWADGVADPSDWVKFTLDLAPYAGDTATIRFRLNTGAGLPADGWYIDSVTIGAGATAATNSFPVTPSWNMVSVPRELAATHPDSIYPGAGGRTFGYNGGYYRTDSIRHGSGYWSKFDSARTFMLNGTVLLKDTFKVNAKWNMIGSIGYPVDSSSLKTVPSGILQSSFYAYSADSGYVSSRTLLPGKAYWVKVSQSGRIIASVFYPAALPVALPKDPPGEEIGRLLFTDAIGRLSELPLLRRAGTGGGGELPPAPPAGAYDIRFASNDVAAVADTSGESEFPILFQTVRYPVRVEWKSTPLPGERASLVLGAEVRTLGTGSTVVIETPPPRLLLRFSASPDGLMPGEYALLQNYPNPFNPSTTIRYHLPVGSRVTLRIYNVLGEAVEVLVDRIDTAGDKSAVWDASGMPSGVYYCLLEAGSVRKSMPMLLLR